MRPGDWFVAEYEIPSLPYEGVEFEKHGVRWSPVAFYQP